MDEATKNVIKTLKESEPIPKKSDWRIEQEKKEADRQMREAIKRYRELWNAIPITIDGETVYYNTEWW